MKFSVQNPGTPCLAVDLDRHIDKGCGKFENTEIDKRIWNKYELAYMYVCM